MNSLPKGWDEKAIKGLGNVITGKTPPTKLENMFNGDTPFVTPADIELDITRTARTVTDQGKIKSKIARKGSTLVSCIGNIGYTGNIEEDSCFNQQINAVEWDNDIISDRLGTYSVLFHKEIIKIKASSAVVPIINKSTFESIQLTYPKNPDSQKLIVKILDHAHKIIKKREEAIKLCEQLIEATFYEMFGDPVRNEKNLKQTTLGEISESPQYGLTASAIKNNIGTRFLRITDIDDFGFLGRTEPAYVDIGSKDIDKYKLNENDIVIARTGATAGKSYLYRAMEEEIVFASYLIRFPLKTDIFLPEFVEAYFQTSFYYQQINRFSTGTARANVNANALKKIMIPYPEKKDQEMFVEIVVQNRKFKKSMLAALELEKQQFQALLQAAFEGRLTAHLDGENGE